jgi:very-short-patch-repair endonuclease
MRTPDGRFAVLSVSAATLGPVMPDDRDVKWLLAYQRGVVSSAQALAIGMTAAGLRYRYRPGGPWQRLLPHVYLTSTGEPTSEQLQTAALLYAGQSSVITGPAALREYRVRAPETRRIDVLVPTARHCRSEAFVAIHRTCRLPDAQIHDLAIGYVAPARAVADTVIGLTTRPQVRTVVASAVQQGRCTVAELAAELAAGPVRGSALFRSVLAEVGDGVRSPAEADFRDLIRKSGLPQPLFNPSLYIDGALLAKPDAWWPDRALVVEIDSREWHLSPDDWEATMARDGRLRAAGIRVIHVTPRQVRTKPNWVLGTIADALRTGEPVPGLITVPATA